MKIDLKETNIVIDENSVYAVYAADEDSLDSFSAIFYEKNDWLASCFSFKDGKTLNNYKGDYFCFHSLKDISKGYHLKHIIKLMLGSLGKSDGLTNLLNEYKKVKMGDLDDVEKEIFRLKIAELTGRKIICFVDFCPNTLTIDYPDMSKFEEIKRGIDRLKAKTKVIFFLNSSEDIFNFPAAGVEMTYSSEVGEDRTQGAKFSWAKIKKFFFQK